MEASDTPGWDLLWVASVRASDAPVCTPEVARANIDRPGAELRGTLRAAKVEVEVTMEMRVPLSVVHG